MEERTHLGAVRRHGGGPVCLEEYEYLLLRAFFKHEDGARLHRWRGSLKHKASGCEREVSGMEKLLIKMKR